MSQKAEQDGVFLQYWCLCESPLRSVDQLELDYEALRNNPRVTFVGFLNPDVLMVGTDKITIRHNGIRYLIGEFIIFLVRKKVDNYWEVDFRFWNVTNPLRSVKGEEDPKNVTHIHPHILPTSDDTLIDQNGALCPNGALCISKGQFDVYQYMRMGKMHLAVSRLIEILETYPTGTAYKDVHHWPELGEKDDV